MRQQQLDPAGAQNSWRDPEPSSGRSHLFEAEQPRGPFPPVRMDRAAAAGMHHAGTGSEVHVRARVSLLFSRRRPRLAGCPAHLSSMYKALPPGSRSGRPIFRRASTSASSVR